MATSSDDLLGGGFAEVRDGHEVEPVIRPAPQEPPDPQRGRTIPKRE